MGNRSRPLRRRQWGLALVLLASVIVGFFETGKAQDMEKLAEADRKYKDAEARARTHAAISYWGASAPLGRFLLIRNGNDFCAVRFTDFHRGGDAKPEARWTGGEESLYAEYDWYYQGDGSGDFTKPTVQSGHWKLSQKAAVGLFHPLVWPRGVTIVRCGPFRLGWIYPNNVGFHTTNRKEDDRGNELAPTKWREIVEVNVRDPRLRWYRFDEKRQDIDIPIEQL